MFVQLKTGYSTDQEPCWICRVRFSKSWQTAYFHGLSLRRQQGVRGNFVDTATGDGWWISGPKRDLSDARYSGQRPLVDDEARSGYEAFLSVSPCRAESTGSAAHCFSRRWPSMSTLGEAPGPS
jgi:hypothetical protein